MPEHTDTRAQGQAATAAEERVPRQRSDAHPDHGFSVRKAFFRMLDGAVTEARRRNVQLGVLTIDIDRFREITHVIGQRAGDCLLQEIEARVRGVLRHRDAVIRIGGDEFAVVLPSIMSEDHAVLAARRIAEAVSVPVQMDGRSVEAAASIGVAIFPAHGTSPEELFHQAERAMYEAKDVDSGIGVYGSAEQGAAARYPVTETELRNAIKTNAMDLYFQPKVNLDSGSVCGAEALLRWPHPEHGILTPDKFILLAERSRLINALTLWVINAALRHCSIWHGQGMPIDVSVNLSTKNLQDSELPDLVARALGTWRVRPEHLVLELTETTAMDNQASVMEAIGRLSELGTMLSIDDFGTGYSSLAYLRELPVGELKVDRSFVMRMRTHKADEAIVRTVIQLARNFELTVTAEGVEDRETYTVLQTMGCDMAQGYYISRPVPGDAFLTTVETLKQGEA